jgi:hypothetical protein
MLIMGAILNPMFQNKVRMVKSGMCTEEQYEAGKVEIMDRMERYYERQIVVDSDSGVEESGGNEWDILLPDTGEDSPGKKAAMELDKYFRWTHGVYQPKMEPVKVLGAIDVNGQPQKPV